MYTKQEIILQHHRDGHSQRQISRELGISRKTVSRYLKQHQASLSTGQNESEALSTSLSTPPVYNNEGRSKLRLTQEIQSVIDKLLEENQKKRMSGRAKQQLKKKDIWGVLQEKEFEIGYTTVCNYIRGKIISTRKKEAFIRQEYLPGSSCEFDWGVVKLNILGEQRKFQMAVFTSSYSNYRYAVLYERQDTLAFMESHVSFFSYVGGVYSEMVYDNMRVAVAKFVGKHHKEPTQALLNLRGHYQFNHRFCNAYRGNEKGHVERSVEYVRRKAFGINDGFTSVEEANKHLLTAIEQINKTKQQLTGKNANEMLTTEKEYLKKQKQELACSDNEQLRVDKYATICYRTNRYSVSDQLVDEFVDVKIHSSKIEVFYDNKLVATHKRVYSRHEWVITIEHYLDTFERKPGALSGSVALASRSHLKNIYDTYFIASPRDFIVLLHYCNKKQITDEHLEEVVKRLVNSGNNNVTSEKIIALLGNQSHLEIIHSDPSIQTETTQLAVNQLTQITQLMSLKDL
jgi:transposase